MWLAQLSKRLGIFMGLTSVITLSACFPKESNELLNAEEVRSAGYGFDGIGAVETGSDGRSVRITWTQATGSSVLGYRVARLQEDGSFATVKAVDVSTTEYTDKSLTAETRYTYRVRAYDQDDKDDGNKKVLSITLPSAATAWGFSGASSVQNLGDGLRIVWSAPSAAAGVVGFRVYEYSTATGSLSPLATAAPTATNYDISGLSDGAVRSYVVRAVNSVGGTDGNSNVVTGTVSANWYNGIATTLPTMATANPQATSAVVEISPSSIATQVKIYCSERGGAWGTAKATVTSGLNSSSNVQVSLTGLRAGTTHICRASAVGPSGVEDKNSATVTFQTLVASGTTHTWNDFNNVLLVQAYGDAPNAPSKLSTEPSPSTGAPSAYYTDKRVSFTWNAFDNATGSTIYHVMRVGEGGAIKIPHPLSSPVPTCTSSSSSLCQVCATSGAGAKTCVDTNVGASPSRYDYVVLLNRGGWIDELPAASGADLSYRVRVAVPPSNMVLVHRESVNFQMCTEMGLTPDPLNRNRCAFTGLGATPYHTGSTLAAATPLGLPTGYYDFGYDVFMDRWEAGCRWTKQTTATTCNGKDKQCWGVGAPNNAWGAEGDIFYDAHSADVLCAKKVGGAWQWLYNLTPAQGANAYTNSPDLTHPVPPLYYTTQQQASAACTSSLDADYGYKRLPRRREQLAAIRFNTLTGEPGQVTEAVGLGYNGTTGYLYSSNHVTNPNCNQTYAAGASTGGLFYPNGGIGSNGGSAFTIGSKYTGRCVSRFGVQDLIGNVDEWASDQFTCYNSAAVTPNTCVGKISTIDTTNTDVSTFAYDGVQGLGGSAGWEPTDINMHSLAGNYATSTKVNVPLGVYFLNTSSHANASGAVTVGSAQLPSNRYTSGNVQFRVYPSNGYGGNSAAGVERGMLLNSSYARSLGGYYSAEITYPSTTLAGVGGFRCSLPVDVGTPRPSPTTVTYAAPLSGYGFAGVRSVTGFGNGALVSWDAAQGTIPVSGYRIYEVNWDGSLTLIGSATSTATSFVVAPLSVGAIKQYAVQAVGPGSQTDGNSATQSVFILSDWYAGAVSASSSAYDSATVVYTRNDAASAYRVQCSTYGGSYSQIGSDISSAAASPVPGSSTQLQVSLSGLASGTTYTCRVRAVSPVLSEDSNTNAVSFQTRSYTQDGWQNVLLVQAFGDAPTAPTGQPQVRQVVVTWNAFSNATSSSQFALVRVPSGTPIALTSTDPTACSSSPTTLCTVCTKTGLGVKSCTDTAVAVSPARYDYAVLMRNGSGYLEELPTSGQSPYKVVVPMPPSNMALVHRESANFEMCTALGKTRDPLNKNRCVYRGISATPYNSGSSLSSAALNLDANYYDFGYNLFADRWEGGCAWSVTSAVTCNGSDQNCWAEATPAPTAGNVGDVFWDSSGQTCYLKTGSTTWTSTTALAGSSVTSAVTSVPHATRGYAPISSASSAHASAYCRSRVDATYGQHRLFRRREFVAAAAWPTATDEPGAILKTYIPTREGYSRAWPGSANDCAGTSPASASAVYPFNGSRNRGWGKSTTPYSGVVIASELTKDCVSRFGIQDLVGNAGEAVSEQINCWTTGQTPNYSCEVASPAPTIDSGAIDSVGYRWDGVQGPGGNALNTSASMFGATATTMPTPQPIYFSPPLGVFMVSSGAIYHRNAADSVPVASTSGITTDDVLNYSNIMNAATWTGALDTIAGGGTWWVGARAASRMSWDRVSGSGGGNFRCVLPAE